MAHKGMRGRRKAPKSKLKKTFKDKEKKATQVATKKENPEAGLRKWQKKALREEALRLKDGKQEAPARSVEGSESLQASNSKIPKPNTSVGPDGQKLTKKEAKLLAAQVRHHQQLYAGGGRVLLVGEGNFSFSRALCEQMGIGEHVYATAFDTEATIKRKYPDAAEHRKFIEEECGGTTLVGVDATRLHRIKEFQGAFRTIVWNFPHMGSGEKDVERSIAQHQDLFVKFFVSASKCLSKEEPGAAIHVALKAGEPYKSWKIVQMAKAGAPELTLRNAVQFSLTAWPGYAHRRTVGFNEKFSKKDSEELQKGAKVYVFVKGEAEASDDGE
eukprot:TRINITY_DN8571_c0_g2_i1.p1 TRINITY_DN8571_c0_g2~~TRINITY_DN8571_c0_g2_i1.p1  ORF type:complete len:329 (+),score=75.32 TRINITY_DN8571_c0_g2_i1:98-1084(+)